MNWLWNRNLWGQTNKKTVAFFLSWIVTVGFKKSTYFLFIQQILCSYQELSTSGYIVENKRGKTSCLPGFDTLLGWSSKLYNMLYIGHQFYGQTLKWTRERENGQECCNFKSGGHGRPPSNIVWAKTWEENMQREHHGEGRSRQKERPVQKREIIWHVGQSSECGRNRMNEARIEMSKWTAEGQVMWSLASYHKDFSFYCI